MASINQLISEIAHSVQQADSVPVRNAIRLGIIHARNRLIRNTYNSHGYIDRVLQQRFKITLINCPDGDISDTFDLNLKKVKRSLNRVPRPVRIDNGHPFISVRTTGFDNPIEIPFIKEPSAKFYTCLPGMACLESYDYINQYLYINLRNSDRLLLTNQIIVEAAFENPFEIPEEHFNKEYNYSDDDEFMISEDMIDYIKKFVLETFNPNIVRQTNEIPTPNLMK